MKILIAEPEAARQRQLRTILTSLGHKSADIETSMDAKTALSLIRKKRFECGFICMGSAQLDGMDLLKNIRSGASAKALPLIAYSSDVTKEGVIAAHEAGANSFLAYPFSVSDVETALHKAVK